MNWFIYLFGSGTAFFLGIAMIFAALALFKEDASARELALLR